jgi:hypothetical protein
LKRRYHEMLEDEHIALKNKITELRERLNQIYSQSALDAHKSKAFEGEFSLYLKASEHAHHERMEGIRLQRDGIKFGLVMLTVLTAFMVYGFSLHLLLGMLILLGFGIISCGFMYLLLAGEIQTRRAGEYCRELEAYFKQYRWSTEQAEPLHLTGIPLWEEYRGTWDNDLFAAGPYEKTAVYAPFRIVITLVDVSALGYLIYSFLSHGAEISWTVMATSGIVWAVAVTLQMLLVNTIITTLEKRPSNERPEAYQKNKISWNPGTWLTLIELFLNLDIIFPQESKKVAKKNQTQ